MADLIYTTYCTANCFLKPNFNLSASHLVTCGAELLKTCNDSWMLSITPPPFPQVSAVTNSKIWVGTIPRQKYSPLTPARF